jgi:cyclophilin family peptidyl-prolyl cis-trans isomerase
MKNGRKCVILLLAALLVLCGCSPSSSPSPETPVGISERTEVEAEEARPQGTPVAILETEKGEISFELLKDIAPKTVDHFITLAELGFYTRTTFHRVIKDLMIQGGDPNSRDNDPYNDGQGTSGKHIKAEISSELFDRGIVAMAHQAGNRHSGSCQFFITLRRVPEWDGEYAVFGKVIEGIEVAQKISRSPLSKSTHPNLKNRPAGKQLIKSIRVEYR